jgi:hypothetical protein
MNYHYIAISINEGNAGTDFMHREQLPQPDG